MESVNDNPICVLKSPILSLQKLPKLPTAQALESVELLKALVSAAEAIAKLSATAEYLSPQVMVILGACAPFPTQEGLCLGTAHL